MRVSLDRYKGEHIALLEDAKTIAAELRTAVANGTYPPKPETPTEQASAATFAVAATRWFEQDPLRSGKNKRGKRGESDEQKMKALCA